MSLNHSPTPSNDIAALGGGVLAEYEVAIRITCMSNNIFYHVH